MSAHGRQRHPQRRHGDDKIWGGSGNDNLSGGTSNDTVVGGFGSDRMDGGAGNDVLLGRVPMPARWSQPRTARRRSSRNETAAFKAVNDCA